MRIHHTILFLIAAISSLCSYSQPNYKSGYIITHDNDTINGLVNDRTNSNSYNSCLFKKGSTEVNYLPSDIKGYGINDFKHFTTGIVSNEFVEVLVIGKVSLYRHNRKFIIEKDKQFHSLSSETIRPDQKDAIPVQDSKWKGVVNYIISDCITNASEKIANLSLEEESLTKIVTRYNECSKKPYYIYKVSKKWIDFDLGASLGVHSSRLALNEVINYSPMEGNYSSVNWNLGLASVIHSPRLSNKIAFQIEARFQSSYYTSLIEESNVIYEFEIDYNALTIPFGFKYRINNKNKSINLMSGFVYKSFIDPKSIVLTETLSSNNNNVFIFPSQNILSFANAKPGLWLGLEYLIHLKNIRTGLSVQYERIPTVENSDLIDSSLSEVSLNLVIYSL